MSFMSKTDDEKDQKRINKDVVSNDVSIGGREFVTIGGVPFSVNMIILLACCWTIVFGSGCIIRVHYAHHWNGYIHAVIPCLGFTTIVTTNLSYCLEKKHSKKALIISTVIWSASAIAAISLIVRSVYVFQDLTENRTLERFRSDIAYGFIWILFTDLLCLITIIIDIMAAIGIIYRPHK
ncbi:hypothetical protein DICVIV_06130 [Dictyocaulus viviparus]|uniref:Uncharacterized protein n=1 Tax=Dictyocaulus viviparus TaxID=29172 RepID=A0A0D8XVE0_DICVI|nr:hypothetical protein DICVIV_06130 [Dictyocaulus viviparus]